MALKRQLRLHKADDFARVREQGKVVSHRDLLLSFAPNTFDHNRYGFITSKRLGKAVVRNRVRRRLRESIRQHHPHLRSGYDIVLIARSGAVLQPFNELHRIIEELARRASLLETRDDLHLQHNSADRVDNLE
jgi:ribonuclease P protein component